jgi:hypothetical protein
VFWALLKPTDDVPVYEMWPVNEAYEFEEGHISGISCPCMPCLDERVGDARLAEGDCILYHHVMIEGRPQKSAVWDSHGCRLK